MINLKFIHHQLLDMVQEFVKEIIGINNLRVGQLNLEELDQEILLSFKIDFYKHKLFF